MSSTKQGLSQTDFVDMQLFLKGYLQWQEQQGIETRIDLPQSALPETTARTEPFTAVRYQELAEKSLAGNPTLDASKLPPQFLEKMSDSLKRLGLEEFLDDGKITTEEYLFASAERGKAEMALYPDRYNPSEESVELAARRLAERGIDDHDGSMAMGLAVNSERMVQRANEGLGLSPAAAPAQPQPEMQHSYGRGMAPPQPGSM